MFSTKEKCGVSTVLSALSMGMVASSDLGLVGVVVVGGLVWALSYLLYSLK